MVEFPFSPKRRGVRMPDYFDYEPSPNPYPIPPGYASLREALKRAIEKWENDGRSKLIGLLAFGQLKWWKSSFGKEPELGDATFWAKRSPEDFEKIFREERFGETR